MTERKAFSTEKYEMRIAICDDEQAQRALLEKYISEWGHVSGQGVQIEAFSSSEQFLFHWEDDKAFDLLVLDIEMGQMNGMELARKLRQEKESVGILFVTGFEQYMSQGYEVEALHYLLKPIQREKLFAVLDKAAAKNPPKEKHLFQTKEGVISIPLSDVWYIEAQGHQCMLHTGDEQYTLPQGIGSLRRELEGQRDFQACHRSYLVNMKHVSAVKGSELILDNDVRLPVSRGMEKAVGEAFIRCYR